MVINNDPDYELKKKAQERLNRTEEERKDALFAELRNESVSIICLAVVYAKNFEEIGEDVTKKWETVQQQTAILEKAYNKGFEEGVIKGREAEREQIKKNYKLVRTNPHFSEPNTNSKVRTDTVSGARRDLVQQTDEPHRRNCTKKRRKRK